MMAEQPQSPPKHHKTDGNAGFLRAARDGNLEEVLDYLKGSTDINTSNPNGLNALHLASKEGHINIVTELLNRGANVEAATKKGNTALHIASLAGHEEIVRKLVENGAQVNLQAQAGFTPLYMASQEGHSDVVKFLLSVGANQGLSTEDGFTPLAVALQQGHEKVVSVLLEHDAKGKVRLPALHIAAKKDDVKSAALLLQNEQNSVELQTKGGLVNDTTKSGFTPLHIAAHYGNINVANLLIQRNADVNFRAKNNITPLHVASRWGKLNMVNLLLDNNATIDEKTRDGLTPLHCASRSGHESVVDTLLERGSPHSAKTKNGLTPLHMAAQGDHEDCARLLLYHKASLNEVTVDYLTPLHVAAHCGNVKTAKLLLDRKCEPNARALNGFTPLHIACKKNRIKVVELLLKYGASIESKTESGLTPLHVASFMGHMNIVIYLIQHNANPNTATVRGETSLHLAARANQTDIIRILLRNSATVDARAREQQTPLHIAARLGNEANVLLLLQHGASVDATTKDKYTPLHIAAKEGHDEVAQVLLDHEAQHDITTKKGFTPLHIAAKYGNIKVARLLLQKEANPDISGKNGLTPLHVATHYNHANVAQLLLENKANPHAAAKNGYTPLHIAAKKNQMDIATMLLEYGAKPDAESKNGFTPLHLAAQEGHTDIVSLLLEKQANVNSTAHNGLTPMHLAAQEDRVQVAEILVKHRSETDVSTKAGYTPLHTACHFGQVNMVRFLLDHEASVNSTTKVGYTPLHQAAQQGHVQVVSTLLKNQASPNAVTNNGQTPLAIAQRLGYISVVEILKPVTEVQGIMPATEDKYKVVSPETMQETFISDSEDEGADDFLPQSPIFGKPISEQHVYLPYYEGQKIHNRKSLGEDSISLERGGSASPLDTSFDKDYMEAQTTSQSFNAMYSAVPPSTGRLPVTSEANRFSSYSGSSFSTSFDPDNVLVDRSPVYSGFLISFMVDARGGAMRGCRHPGVRIIIPPRKCCMPTRITCRLVKKEKLTKPPPMLEGEGLAARVLEMGPAGTKFLGPVLLEVPHFASLRGKEREVVILRSDNGETWYEHPTQATEDAVAEALGSSAEELDSEEDLSTKRIKRILTTDLPMYFALVSRVTRVKQESTVIGTEGGVLSSNVVPQVQAVFPEGTLRRPIPVGLQAQPIAPELVAKLLGNRVAVSPIVTIEPRRRQFHKPITLTIPVPKAAQKGMINQYGGERPTLRLLFSLAADPNPAAWEDVTDSKPMTLVDDCVSFTTKVSARFWLIDCQNVAEAAQMASVLYQEAVTVPYMAKFVVFAKRDSPEEGKLRIFCMTDDKDDKTLEKQEKFYEVARSRDIEVLEGRPQFVEMAGNLIPVTKSGDQLHVNFRAFRENRLPCTVKIRDQDQEPSARVAFMKEPKVARGEAPQTPICNLNIRLPDMSDSGELDPDKSAEIRKRHDFLRGQGLVIQDSVNRAEMKLSDIADTVQGDWVMLAQQLHISISDINHFKNDYKTVGDQALAMLHFWVQKNGDKATGNELENALRRINRDDVVRKCMYNVERVDDEVEAAAARAIMDQSGFDTFKEEVGITKDSLKRGMSLDVQYDEQDIIKESESATEESPTGDRVQHPPDRRSGPTPTIEVTSPRPESICDDIMEVAVDDRRPPVEPSQPPVEDEEEEARRRKEAFLELALQLDQYADQKEAQFSRQDSDQLSAESVKEEEIVKSVKSSPTDAFPSWSVGDRTAEHQQQQHSPPHKPHVTFSEEPDRAIPVEEERFEGDEEEVQTPPPSPTEKLDSEEPVLAAENSIAEAASRLAYEATDEYDSEGRSVGYGQARVEQEVMYSRAEIATEHVSSYHGSLQAFAQASSEIVSPVSDGGSSYHDEPSPVPEPTLPEHFKADELAYEKAEEEEEDDRDLDYQRAEVADQRSESFEEKPSFTGDVSSDGDIYRTPEQSFDDGQRPVRLNVLENKEENFEGLANDQQEYNGGEAYDEDDQGSVKRQTFQETEERFEDGEEREQDTEQKYYDEEQIYHDQRYQEVEERYREDEEAYDEDEQNIPEEERTYVDNEQVIHETKHTYDDDDDERSNQEDMLKYQEEVQRYQDGEEDEYQGVGGDQAGHDYTEEQYAEETSEKDISDIRETRISYTSSQTADVHDKAVDDLDSAVDAPSAGGRTLGAEDGQALEASRYQSEYLGGQGPELATSLTLVKPELTAALGDEDYVDRREETVESQKHTLSREQTPERGFGFQVAFKSSQGTRASESGEAEDSLEVLDASLAPEETYYEEVKDDGTIVRHRHVRTIKGGKPTVEMELVSEEAPPREETVVEDHEEILPDGTVHTTHKVIRHSFKRIKKHTRSQDGEEEVKEEKEMVPGSLKEEVVETFDEPPRMIHEEEEKDEVLEDGTKVHRKIILNRMVHRIRTHQESFDSDHGRHTEDYEIDEIIPGTESAFVAGVDSSDTDSDEDDYDEEDAHEVHNVEEKTKILEDGTIIKNKLLTTETTRTVRSRSGSIDETSTDTRIEEEYVTPSPRPRSPVDDDPVDVKSISNVTHKEETTEDDVLERTREVVESMIATGAIKAVSGGGGESLVSSGHPQADDDGEYEEEWRELDDPGFAKRQVTKVTYYAGDLDTSGDEPYSPGAQGDEDVQTHRLMMKKEVHKKTTIGLDGHEETTVREDSQIQQDNEPPEELRESMQEIINQFMESDPQPAHLPLGGSKEDEV